MAMSQLAVISLPMLWLLFKVDLDGLEDGEQ